MLDRICAAGIHRVLEHKDERFLQRWFFSDAVSTGEAIRFRARLVADESSVPFAGDARPSCTSMAVRRGALLMTAAGSVWRAMVLPNHLRYVYGIMNSWETTYLVNGFRSFAA